MWRARLPPVAANAFIIYGVLSDAAISLWKPFAVTYLKHLGGGAAHIFAWNYLPALFAAIGLPLSLLAVRRIGGLGLAGILFTLAGRCVLLPLAFLPALPEALRPWLFLALASLMAMPDAAAQSTIQAYAGRVFSPQDRSGVLSRRLAWGQPVIILAGSIGLLLRTAGADELLRLRFYQGAFLLAFGLGMSEAAALFRFRRMAGGQPYGARLGDSLRRMLRDRRFLAFFVCSLIFHFGWMMGWPLFSVWQVIDLKADEGWLFGFSAVASLTMFLSYGFWRRLTERRGLGLVLALSTLGQAVNPVVIALCDTLPLQLACQLFTGFFTAGVNAALIAGLLGYSPETDDKVSFAAMYNVSLFIIQVISQTLGQALFHAVGIKAAMYLVALVRLLGAGAFLILFARGGRRRREMLP